MRRLLLGAIACGWLAASCGGGGGSGITSGTPSWLQFRHDPARSGESGVNLSFNQGFVRRVPVDDPNAPLAPVSASAIVDTDNIVYAASEGGTLRALVGNDLTDHWPAQTACPACCPAGSQGCDPSLGPILSTPALHQLGDVKTLIVASQTGRIYFFRIDESEIDPAPECRACFVPDVVSEFGPGTAVEFISSPTYTINGISRTIAQVLIGARITLPGAMGEPDQVIGKLYAINGDGSVAWRYPRRGAGGVAPITSSPTLDNQGAIHFVTDDGSLVTLTENGLLIRTISLPGVVPPADVLTQTVVGGVRATYVGGADGVIHAFNEDGSTRFSREIGDERFLGSILVGVQSLIEPTATPTLDPNETPSPESTPTVTETPVLPDSSVFAVSESGQLIVLNESDGREMSPSRVALEVPVTGQVLSSPALSSFDGTVAFGTTDGMVYVLDTAFGVGPRVCEGGSNDDAVCNDDEDCLPDGVCADTAWPVTLGRCLGDPETQCRSDADCGGAECVQPAIRSSPALAADATMYLGADDGFLYVFANTGTPARKTFTPRPTPTMPPTATPEATATEIVTPSATEALEPTATETPAP